MSTTWPAVIDEPPPSWITRMKRVAHSKAISRAMPSFQAPIWKTDSISTGSRSRAPAAGLARNPGLAETSMKLPCRHSCARKEVYPQVRLCRSHGAGRDPARTCSRVIGGLLSPSWKPAGCNTPISCRTPGSATRSVALLRRAVHRRRGAGRRFRQAPPRLYLGAHSHGFSDSRPAQGAVPRPQ